MIIISLLEKKWFAPPIVTDALYQVWLKLAQCFWRGRVLNAVNQCISLCGLTLLSPHRRGMWLFIWTNLKSIQITQGCLYCTFSWNWPCFVHCAMFGWNWPSSSGEKNENVKSLPWQTEKLDQKTYLSLQIRWA